MVQKSLSLPQDNRQHVLRIILRLPEKSTDEPFFVQRIFYNLENQVKIDYESMLKACLVGKLVTEPLKLIRPITTKFKELKSSEDITEPFNKSPIVPPIALLKSNETQETGLSHDWYQTNTTIVITVYTKRKSPEYYIIPENILVEVTEDNSVDVQTNGRDNDSITIIV